MDESLLKAVTLGIALLGAGLGLINTWRAWSSDRVKIRVTPAWGIFAEGPERLLITVVNLSGFAITVTSIGLDLATRQHAPLFDGELTEGSLPKRLESRTSLTLVAPPGTHQVAQMSQVVAVYAETACGLHIRGNSGALRGMVKEARARR